MRTWRFFHWQVLRYIGRHRLLGLLNVLSVATGVAVFLAVQLANQSARRAFAASIDVVAGKAQLEVTAPANDLYDGSFLLMQETSGIAAATPLVRGIATLPDLPGEYLDLLGIDIFTNGPFRTFQLTNLAAQDFDLERWLRDPDAVALSESFVARHKLKPGDSLRVEVNGTERIMRIGFVIADTALRGWDEHLAAMDIGWAQELLAMRGKLSAIELRLDNGADRAQVIDALRKKLPANVEVTPPARRSEQIDQLLSSFQLNLTAMSLVSLLVGGFLVFNTISASTVRRRREIGILRALGCSGAQIGAIFIGEAIASGFVGTLLGLALGTRLAHGLVDAVSRTISSLYLLVSVHDVVPDLPSYIAAAALGLISAVVAASWPARTAAMLPPVLALHPTITSEVENRAWNGSLAAAAVASVGSIATSVIALQTGPRWIAFVAAFLCLGAASLFTPALAASLAFLVQISLAAHPAKFLELRLAAVNLRRSLTRNAITIAALACAIAMAVGVTLMILSFRRTVNIWIEQTLVAELFVTPATNEIAGPSSFVPTDVIAFFEQHPAVKAVDTFRQIELPFRGGRMALAALRPAGSRKFSFVRGDTQRLMERFRHERCVVVSEAFARKHRIRVGDHLEIATPNGTAYLPVAGIFYDYSRDDGVVFTSAANFAQLFGDNRANSIGVYLNDRRQLDDVATDFRNEFSGRGEFAVYSNAALRQRVFEVFDQTFAVTHVLRAIAVIIAIASIFLSFTTLIVERARDLGILRALGTSRWQLCRMVLWEAVLIGVGAAILGIGAGAGLALILTAVINRAFFGWTVPLQLSPTILGITAGWVITAAVGAAVWPAIRASRVKLAEVLRAE